MNKKNKKQKDKTPSGDKPRTVAIEDLATEFVTEFVVLCHKELQMVKCDDQGGYKVRFLEMPFSKRRKLVEEVMREIERKNGASNA